jgi:hypothetical protein
MPQSTGNAKNILVGASPLFISNINSSQTGYVENAEAGLTYGTGVPAYVPGTSYTTTLNAVTTGTFYYRNVGYTNNGLQITYNPSYGSVTVDQLLDTAKLFKESMEVMIATEMSEATLENINVAWAQATGPATSGTGTSLVTSMGMEAGALGQAPRERQLIAVGNAPTTLAAANSASERVYYARRVLSVQQSQHSLARNTATTFPVTFRLLPDGNYSGSEYGKIMDRILAI